MHPSRARGAASKGLVLAMVFGIAGGGFAAWTLMRSFTGEKRPVGPPSMQARGGGGPPRAPAGATGDDVLAAPSERVERRPPAEPLTFAPIKGDADVEGLLSELRAAISSAAGSSQDLASLGAEAQSKLGESFSIAMTPYLKGDVEGLLQAAQALGARPPGAEGASEAPRPVAITGPGGRPNPIMALLKHASIDVTKAKVLPWRPREGLQGAGVNSGEEGGPSAVIGFRTGGLFTDIDDFEKKKLPAVEVRAPLLPHGAKVDGPPTWVGAVMVWNQAARAWQPAQINLMSDDPEALRGLMGRAMPAR